MSDLNDLQRKLLDALGLKPEDHIVQVIIDIGPRDFPVVTVKREIWLTKESGPLREVIEEYRLMPRKAADTDAMIAYHVGYEAGRRARIDEEGFERTPVQGDWRNGNGPGPTLECDAQGVVRDQRGVVQGEFKIEAALKDAQYKEYKDVRFRNWAVEQLQGSSVNVDWSALTEPEKPKLR